MKKECTLSGIIKHSNGIGFKITFNSKDTANKYKDMLRFILAEDGFKINYRQGYYDIYNEKGENKKWQHMND